MTTAAKAVSAEARPSCGALIERLDEASLALLEAARRAPKVIPNGQLPLVKRKLREAHIELERSKRRAS